MRDRQRALPSFISFLPPPLHAVRGTIGAGKGLLPAGRRIVVEGARSAALEMTGGQGAPSAIRRRRPHVPPPHFHIVNAKESVCCVRAKSPSADRRVARSSSSPQDFHEEARFVPSKGTWLGMISVKQRDGSFKLVGRYTLFLLPPPFGAAQTVPRQM